MLIILQKYVFEKKCQKNQQDIKEKESQINTDMIGQSTHLQWSSTTCLSLNSPSQPIAKTID